MSDRYFPISRSEAEKLVDLCESVEGDEELSSLAEDLRKEFGMSPK